MRAPLLLSLSLSLLLLVVAPGLLPLPVQGSLFMSETELLTSQPLRVAGVDVLLALASLDARAAATEARAAVLEAQAAAMESFAVNATATIAQLQADKAGRALQLRLDDAEARLDKAEQVVPDSSPLMDLVLAVGRNLTAADGQLESLDAQLQQTNSSLAAQISSVAEQAQEQLQQAETELGVKYRRCRRVRSSSCRCSTPASAPTSTKYNRRPCSTCS